MLKTQRRIFVSIRCKKWSAGLAIILPMIGVFIQRPETWASFYRFDGILHIHWALNDSDTTRLLSLFALFEASCSWHDSRLCIFTAHVLKSVWFSLSQEPSASKLFCWNFKWWRLMRKKKIPPFQILFNEPVDLFQPGFLLLAKFSDAFL